MQLRTGEARLIEAGLRCSPDLEVREPRNAMSRRKQDPNPLDIEFNGSSGQAPAHGGARLRRELAPAAARVLVFLCLLCLGSVHGWAQQDDQQRMKGLDEQVQEIKSDVLSIAEELNRLEERLLYPSGTQVAIFLALTEGDALRLDSVELQIDGQLVSHSIYSFKELEALRKGGVQRIYVGNVATGNHQLDVLVKGKLEGGEDFSRAEQFTFRKDVKPKLVELTLNGSDPGNASIELGNW
jgi:hypothetical protein